MFFRIFAVSLIFCLGVSIVHVHGDRMHPRQPGHRARGIVNPKTGKVTQFEDKEHWFKDAQGTLDQKIMYMQLDHIERVAKNTVFFLGDGMSVGTVTAARILKGQMDDLPHGGEEAQLHMDTFPHIGVSRTFCTDVQTADSACSATAYLCGTKANDATIGVTPTVFDGDDCSKHMDPANQVSSVLAWAQAAGKSTGIVTTTRVTHASPAGTYAHIAQRDWESDLVMANDNQDTENCDDIAEQLILRDPGRKIDVILGGGRREFLPNNVQDIEETTTNGRRLDGKHLINDWKTANGADDNPNARARYITNRDQLLEVDRNPTGTDKLLGLFEYDHVTYKDLHGEKNDPSLEEMTQVAIKILSKNPKGFFLFVEGGRIDHAHHDTLGQRALVETIEFDKAIKKADDLTVDDETLILVTSDHSHTMTISGYPPRGTPILKFGDNQQGDDALPYSTISYANGPGYKPNYNATTRYDITNDNFDDVTYRYMATVPIQWETHGGDDVLIFSKGPFAHLLTGIQQQSYIPHVVGYAACIGTGRKFEGCTDGQSDGGSQFVHGSTGGGIIALTLLALAFLQQLLALSRVA